MFRFHHLLANSRGERRSSDKFYFLGSKITADGDLSHGENTVTNLDSILKSTDITLPMKFSHIVKAMVFLVVIHKCESWTIKKTECQSIDAFEWWC